MTETQSAAPYRPQSVPVYREPTLRSHALHHILVTQTATAAALGRLIQSFEQPGLPTPRVLCAAVNDFERQLKALLDAAAVGTQLYVLGDEAFLWRIHGMARTAGMHNEEIDLIESGPVLRRVFCVHCGCVQDSGPQAVVFCGNCQVHLSVREHFSQRLGAYLGVCENPDQPYAQAQS
ncbi:dimethylamine monooxygenase subunit DmmA family protein [Pseudomonas sp. H11T01]|uniref:dimethylamine monooxygenase subunit DmmA family protein n=1 Tax=Pseudomonas sp. H11T01 TaxID=3402749 RepID=UPI003AD49308